MTTQKSPKRVVLDTNILIAAAYAKDSASRTIIDAILRSELTLLLSQAVQREYEYIVRKAIHRRDFSPTFNELLEKAQFVEPTDVPRVVADDPDDDKLVALATSAQADALISNDHHLLELGFVAHVRVMRPGAFLAWLRST